MWDTTDYSGMKRSWRSEMDGDNSMKRPRYAGNPGDTELRILIQSKAAGSVIGKGGQKISRLRSENPASITVPDCPGPERVLTIGGSDDVILKVLEEVMESLDEELSIQHAIGYATDARMLVHQSQAGCIIGKGGQNIKELIKDCGCQIKVYTDCCPQSTDRVVQITGDRDRTCNTIARIIELLKDSPVKGNNDPYDPHNFDEFFASEYGGWGEAPKGRFGPPMGQGPPPLMGPEDPDGDFDGLRGGPPKGFMNGNGPMETASTQVTIPKDSAGAVIGKGGARIRQIRSDSGASISIEDPRPGANERVITITGSDPQIKHAQYLLQQNIREYGGPAGRRF